MMTVVSRKRHPKLGHVHRGRGKGEGGKKTLIRSNYTRNGFTVKKERKTSKHRRKLGRGGADREGKERDLVPDTRLSSCS